MKSPFLIALFASVVLWGTSPKASALSATLYYDFAFNITDSTSGQVIETGEILGLQDNATSMPEDIIINFDPNNSEIALGGDAGFSLKDNGYILSPYVVNTFTVTNGIMTGVGAASGELGAGVGWYQVTNPDPYSQIAYNWAEFGSSNGTQATDGPFYGNDDGFSGTTYFPGTISSVPEPSQWGWAIFLTVASVTCWRRFSTRSAQSA